MCKQRAPSYVSSLLLELQEIMSFQWHQLRRACLKSLGSSNTHTRLRVSDRHVRLGISIWCGAHELKSIWMRRANYQYVCMYVCMYVCLELCKYVCLKLCKYVCMYVCMYVCLKLSMYVCMYVCLKLLSVYVWGVGPIPYRGLSDVIFKQVCMYVCVYVCLETYIHTYMLNFKHTYIHTYIHTCVGAI